MDTSLSALPLIAVMAVFITGCSHDSGGSADAPETVAEHASGPFLVLPPPGPSDPGPPEFAPSTMRTEPTFAPPPIPTLPPGLPAPPPGLEEALASLTQIRAGALVADTTERSALLLDTTDRRDVEKQHAALILGLTGDSDSLPALHHALVQERNPAVRSEAARALGRLGAPGSLVPLWDALRDRNQGVRVAAISAMGFVGRSEAIPVLSAIASNGHGADASAALTALATLGAREELAVLDPGPPERHAEPGSGWSPTRGLTFHVDSTDGDDAQDGSEATPFRTLSRAVLALRPGEGDTLFATSGEQHIPFREEVDVLPQASGTPDSPTVLAAWPGRPQPVLDGELRSAPGQPGMRIGLHVGADYVHVRGFIVRHYADSGIDLSGSTGSVIQRCVAENNGRHGLFVYYAPRSLISESAVRGSEAQGISIRNSPGTSVLGGVSLDNGIDGLLLLQNSDDVLVHGLRASGNKRGIAVTAGSNRARIIGAHLEGNGHAVVIEPNSDAVVIESGAVAQE